MFTLLKLSCFEALGHITFKMVTPSKNLARLLNLNKDDSSALAEEFLLFFLNERDDSDDSTTSDDDQTDGK